MAGNPGLTQSRIAAREGVSRARVTQVMNLLQLPGEIQTDLLSPPAPLEIHAFSERSLRALVSCLDEKSQVHQWRTLIEGMRASTLV
jgi:ParB-like chromosome segregation protein Spo0J